MKKIIIFSFLVVAAGLINVSCTASASVKKADATRLDNSRQVAYVTTLTK